MLQLIVHDAIDEFLRAAEHDLAQDEVTNGLMLGVTLRVKQHPGRIEHQPYLATVHADGALLAAGVMTPPHGLIAYAATDDPLPAMRLLAENLVANRWPLPTVNGVATVSRTFAEAWRHLTGGEVAQEMALRVFELRAVTPPVGVAGQFRQAAIEDADLIFAWYTAFHVEATPAQALPRRAEVERSLTEGNVYLWEDDGRPASLAAKGRRTPRGISVGPVIRRPKRVDMAMPAPASPRSANIFWTRARRSAHSSRIWPTQLPTASTKRSGIALSVILPNIDCGSRYRVSVNRLGKSPRVPTMRQSILPPAPSMRQAPPRCKWPLITCVTLGQARTSSPSAKLPM